MLLCRAMVVLCILCCPGIQGIALILQGIFPYTKCLLLIIWFTINLTQILFKFFGHYTCYKKMYKFEI